MAATSAIVLSVRVAKFDFPLSPDFLFDPILGILEKQKKNYWRYFDEKSEK